MKSAPIPELNLGVLIFRPETQKRRMFSIRLFCVCALESALVRLELVNHAEGGARVPLLVR